MDGSTSLADERRPDVSFLLPMRRWRLRDWLLFGLPVLAALVVAVLHLTSPPPTLSLDVYERIDAGMTQREVERLVGARPGGYGTFWHSQECFRETWGRAKYQVIWGSRSGILRIGLDAQGRVVEKSLDYRSDTPADRPDLWPWWRRLIDRQVPTYGIAQIYSPF